MGQPEVKGWCKINPLIRAINAILITSFPILATVPAGCHEGNSSSWERLQWGGDFKNTLLPISFQSSILNARYKKPLCSLLFWAVFLLLANPLSLRFFLFYLCFQFFGVFFFFLFGNQNGNSLLYALRFPAQKEKKAVLLFLSLIHPFCLLCCGQDFKS